MRTTKLQRAIELKKDYQYDLKDLNNQNREFEYWSKMEDIKIIRHKILEYKIERYGVNGLAELSGVSKPTIIAMKNGSHYVSDEKWNAIVRAEI